MRALSKLFTATILSTCLLSGLGCDGSGSPMAPEEEAKLVKDQNAEMERYHAAQKSVKTTAHKTARHSNSSASAEAQYKAD